jgi:hypothetical protein
MHESRLHDLCPEFLFPYSQAQTSAQKRKHKYAKLPQANSVTGLGRAVVQTISRRPLATEACVSPCGICGGQSGTGTGFF